MGLLDRWRGRPSDAEIVASALTQVLQALVEDRRAQQQMLDKVVELHRDHMAVTQRLLDQYTSTLANAHSSLDERLFRQEDEWESVEQSPFEGLN